MLLFCPNCSNTLTIRRGLDNANRWICQTCPYEYPIGRELVDRHKLPRKQIDDVMGGEDSWKNVDSTEVACTRRGCEGERAYFMQIQIRSADEPSTLERYHLDTRLD